MGYDRDGKTADGSPVQQWTCNTTSTTMQWKLVVVGNIKYYTQPVSYAQFINVRSGKCLDIRGGSYAPGTPLQIYRCTSRGIPGSGRENVAQVFALSDTMLLPIPPP
jgi:Ricin-type beta-trefoil lectin domain-like